MRVTFEHISRREIMRGKGGNEKGAGMSFEGFLLEEACELQA